MTLTKEQYLKFIEDQLNGIKEEYYSDEDDDFCYITRSDKPEVLTNKKNLLVNLDGVPENLLLDKILNNSNLEIKNFLIKINYLNMKEKKFNIQIYEYKNQKFNSINSRILFKIRPDKDSRFANCKWLSYFIQDFGSKIPLEDMIYIIKYLSKVDQLTFFT